MKRLYEAGVMLLAGTHNREGLSYHGSEFAPMGLRAGLVACWLLAGSMTPASLFAQRIPSDPTAESARQARAALRLTYLGNAGWEITDGSTAIIVDPYISQFKRWESPAEPRPNASTADDTVKYDTVGIDRRITRADYVLVTHGHGDHMAEAPYVARRHGATIIGHETATNLARASGVSDSNLITVRGGEDFEFGSFSLRVIPSLHSALNEKRYNNRLEAGRAPRDLKAPLRQRDFVEGGSLAYLLRIGGQQVLIMGSMNFIEREMEGLRPDVALVGAAPSRLQIYHYTARLMRALGNPRVVMPVHADAYGDPNQSAALKENIRRFTDEVKAVSPRTRVIAPKWFEPLEVPRP